ncbi:MAG: PaaI family thioesterase [Bacteroidota bacterium]
MSVERVRQLLTRSRYHQWLGLELVGVEPGRVVLRLPYRPQFLADENDSYVHGGVIATVVDVAGGFALITELGRGLPTVDLRVDYLRPAPPGADLTAEGHTVRLGRNLGVADVTVSAAGANGGKPVAVGRAVYYTAQR